MINNIFEGLVHINFDGSTSPGAAEKWEVSADGLTYTFTLRGTDKWSNGDTVTSQDFKDSWLRILDPATAADYAYQLYFIKGAEEFNGGKGTADAVAIDATDPKVLKVTLKAPTPWFVPLMAHHAYFPIPAEDGGAVRRQVDRTGEHRHQRPVQADHLEPRLRHHAREVGRLARRGQRDPRTRSRWS